MDSFNALEPLSIVGGKGGFLQGHNAGMGCIDQMNDFLDVLKEKKHYGEEEKKLGSLGKMQSVNFGVRVCTRVQKLCRRGHGQSICN